MWLTIVSLAVAFFFAGCNKLDNVIPVEPVVTYTLPSASITAAEKITMTTAEVVAKIVAFNSPTTVVVQYKEVGTSWGTAIEKVVPAGNDTFSLPLALVFLKSATEYTVRVVASNKAGEVAPEVKFTTAAVSDVDGNYYGAVQIGTQTWMTSDLKTTHYRDGSAIPNVVENAAWSQLTTGGMCYYNNDSKNTSPLYNWYAAASTGDKSLAPAGWHVATHADWVTLRNYLGGETIAGGKLKSLNNWKSPNTGANNITGFNAIPSSIRSPVDGTFWDNDGSYATWLSVQIPAGNVAYVSFDDTKLQTQFVFNAQYGAAVRCVKD